MSADTPKPRRKHKTAAPVLSVQEVRFCQALLAGMSQYEAFVSAGYRTAGRDRNAIDRAASRTVRKRQVREYLRHLQSVAADAARVTVEEIAAAVRNIAHADRRKLWHKGTLLPPDQWPDDVAATVEAVESDEIFESVPGQRGAKRLAGYTRKVKTCGRMPALRLLAEWKRMVGADAGQQKTAQAPLVVGGEADPGEL